MYIEKLKLKTFLKYTVPAILSMLFISLYTIVDGFFVSRFVGTDALASLNMTMPIYNTGFSIAIMLAVGGSALISIALGKGEKKKAHSRFSFICIVILLTTVLASVFGHIFFDPILDLLGVTPELYADANAYGRIILLSMPFLGIQVSNEYFMRVDDNANKSLVLTIVGGVTNMVLDYVFIARFGWGIAGAGYATLSGIVVAGAIGVFHFSHKPKLLRYGKPVIDFAFLRQATINGSSEMLTELSGIITAVLFNVTLIAYAGPSGVAANSVLLYLNFMFISIALGTTMGIQPLISFNLGAGNKKVIREIVKTAAIVLFSVATFIFVFVQIFNAELTGLFLKDDPATAKIAMEGLRIFVFSVVLSSVNILSSGYFTAINNGKVSAVISLSRSILFIVPIILILPEYLGLTGIWLTRPLAELLTLFVVLVFVSRDSILNFKRAERKSLGKITEEAIE